LVTLKCSREYRYRRKWRCGRNHRRLGIGQVDNAPLHQHAGTAERGSISIQGEKFAMKPDGRGGLLPANSAQLRRIRTRLAMVFQSFNLWQHMTVLGNIIEAPVQVMGVKRR
jgi:ABC-type arginine transport system ATPase subunit